MTYSASNRRAAIAVPVNIRLTPEERARLLGERGEALLALAVGAIKDLAAEEGWPLRSIDVFRWQSQEDPSDETVDVGVEVGPTALPWEYFFEGVIGRIARLDETLEEADRDLFLDRIHYGVRVKR